MVDFITVLQHQTAQLAKKWNSDGTITPYGDAKHFKHQSIAVSNIHDLSTVLHKLEKNRKAGVIRGKLKEGVAEPVLRRKEHFDDVAHHWVMFDVDGFAPVFATDDLSAIHEYIETALPSAFHGASFHWQLSNTHGHEKNAGVLKAHLWFWMDTPYSAAHLSAWQRENAPLVDPAVFRTVQWHYTTLPIMDAGVADPVAVRSGFFKGRGDSVAFDTGPVNLQPLRQSAGVAEGNPEDDPLYRFMEDHDSFRAVTAFGRIGFHCPWAHEHSGDSGPTETIYFAAKTNGFAMGHFQCQHTHCRDRTDAEFTEALGYVEDHTLDFEIVPVDAGQRPEFKSINLKTGVIKSTIEQVVMALRSAEWMGYSLALDTFRDEVVIRRGNEWGGLQDHHYTQLRIDLERRKFEPIGRELIRDAVGLVAYENRFDSAQAWLEGLAWDGVPRVERFFIDCFGTEDSAYTRAVGKYLWSALAGRILVPGVKADMVPILEGDQGLRKTTAVGAIAPAPEFFVEVGLAEKEEDLSRKMRGALVAEIAELDGLHTKEVESIKKFITRTHEKWIPKYKEFATTFPRRLVFIGTTNKTELLADETGNRRWLPMHVESADVERIERERNQLWAEGMALFKRGGVCWQGLDVLSLDAHREYAVTDPWEDRILEWINTPTTFDDGKNCELNGDVPFRLDHLAIEVLNIQPRDLDKLVKNRVGGVLKKHGFELKPVTVHGKSQKMWRKRRQLPM